MEVIIKELQARTSDNNSLDAFFTLNTTSKPNDAVKEKSLDKALLEERQSTIRKRWKAELNI